MCDDPNTDVFVENLLNAFVALLPNISFSPLVTILVAPVFTGVTKHSYSTFAEFLYLDFIF
jgi:hypothetical protein